MSEFDDLVRDMSDEELNAVLGGKPPWVGFKYRPIFKSSLHEKVPLSEEFIRKLEEEGDEEDVYKKFLRKGLRQPGTTKARLEAYLKRALDEAEREGRL